VIARVQKQDVSPKNYPILSLENKARNRFCPLSRIGAVLRASSFRGTKTLPTQQKPGRRIPVKPIFWERHIFGSFTGDLTGMAKKMGNR